MTRRTNAAFIILFLSASANAEPLWNLTDSSLYEEELSTIQPPASISTDQVIEISASSLNSLALGDIVTLSFSDTQAFDFTITNQASYLNGDKGWQAKWTDDDGFVLTLTYSAESVVASVYSPVGKYQLRAFSNPSDDSMYIGWLSPESPDARYAPIDDGGIVLPVYKREQFALLPGQPKGGDSTESSLSGTDVSIVQTFSKDVIVIGEEVEIEITVTNNLATAINNTELAVWFALKNSTLISSDSICAIGEVRTTSGLNKTLNCPIANIPAGGSITIGYTIQSTEQTYPRISNAVFVGDVFGDHVRNNKWVQVIKDTLVDSDNDGISDFNEAILGTDPQNSTSVIADDFVPTVDIMFLYTQRFLEDIGSTTPETEINGLVQLTNEIYANSGAVIEFRPVLYEQTEYTPPVDLATAWADLKAHTDVTLQTIPALRAAAGADITVLIDGLAPTTAIFCGFGSASGIISGHSFKGELFHPFLNDKERYTAIFMPGKSRESNFTCRDSTFAHELGHNFGLQHSRRDSSSNAGTFPWSRGHGVDGSFVTVMASTDDFPGSSKLPLFSNPLSNDCNGLPCGVSRNDPEQGADAVLTINTTRFQLANLRASNFISQNTLRVATLSGGSSSAVITGGASEAGDTFTFRTQFWAFDNPIIQATFEIPTEHQGRDGLTYIVISIGGKGLFLQNSLGEYVAWDGSIGTLESNTDARSLGATEELSIAFSEFQPLGYRFYNANVTVYFAYSIPGTDVFVYTADGVSFNICLFCSPGTQTN